MGSLWLDIRYALRMMAKTPGLTAVLAITLALGIGASTTIFSVVNSVVLRPLPYEQPDRLVRVYTEFPQGLGLYRFSVSAPEFDDLRRACRSCERVGAWANGTASLSGGDRPVRINAAFVTHDVLPILGVKPMLGRWFDDAEDEPGDYRVIVLGYNVWKRAFGGDTTVIGRKITLDAQPVTIVGVMPKGFDFLGGQQAWAPLNLDVSKHNRGGHWLQIVTRLKPDASITSFRAELAALIAEWEKLGGPGTRTHSLHHENHPMIALPFQEDLVGGLASTLWLLQGAVLLVLLISIVNVANLLLARSETRTREVAVRHALGASRRRLVRQFLTESVMLGLVGGGLGVLVAVWAIDGVTALIPSTSPRANEIDLDGTAVVFAVGCAFFASLLFGMAPILHAKKTDLHGALKDGSNRMTSTKARLRVRRALVIGEIVLAVVLVIGCTVMVRSFMKLQQVELGMNPEKVLTFELELPQKKYPGTTGAVFWQRLQERLAREPGVTAHTYLGNRIPSRPINANDINFPDKARPQVPPHVMLQLGMAPWNVDYWQVLGDNSVEALGLRLLEGRQLLPSDTAEAPPVLLVNDAFAKKFYPGESAIGKRVMIHGDDPKVDPIHTIVGVIGDIKQAGIEKPAGTEVFIPWRQVQLLGRTEEGRTSPTSMYSVLRTDGDPTQLTAAVHRIVGELDPTLPISHMRTMDDVMWEAIARPRFLMFLLSAFAGIALLLAAVGIYGVMAHTVAQRTHEIGLRVALGAQPKQVRMMVLRQAATLVGIGVAAGLGVAIGLQAMLDRSLSGLLYGAELSQPVLLAAVAIVVTATALLATWIPVRRATKIEPTVALRSE